MGSVILYCQLPACGKGMASTGKIPVRCPSCGRETKWSTSSLRDSLLSAILWTAEDRRFLRSLRIASE